MANKGYYKGTGTGSTGRHTKHGGYVIEWAKVRTYVVPDGLKDFAVSSILRYHSCSIFWTHMGAPVREVVANVRFSSHPSLPGRSSRHVEISRAIQRAH
jgi:hypothetical protein